MARNATARKSENLSRAEKRRRANELKKLQNVPTTVENEAPTVENEAPTVENEAPTAPKRIRIRNVANSSNEAIRAALLKVGAEVPENADRGALISLARDANLWGESGNVVPLSAKQRYGSAGHCGDEMAEALNAFCRVVGENGNTYLDVGLLAQVASQNEIDLNRWRHLNVGMKRMNLSNVLRGRVKRGETVKVGGAEFKFEGEKLD